MTPIPTWCGTSAPVRAPCRWPSASSCGAVATVTPCTSTSATSPATPSRRGHHQRRVTRPGSTCSRSSEGDLTDVASQDPAAPVDLLVANLPYIPTAVVAELPVADQLSNPAGALDGGPDGLDVVRRLLPRPARRPGCRWRGIARDRRRSGRADDATVAAELLAGAGRCTIHADSRAAPRVAQLERARWLMRRADRPAALPTPTRSTDAVSGDAVRRHRRSAHRDRLRHRRGAAARAHSKPSSRPSSGPRTRASPCSSTASTRSMGLVPERARHAAWPIATGPVPLTLVLPLLRPELVPEAVSGGRDTLGVRIPDHPVPRALARQLGPIAVTSANRSGEPPARTADELIAVGRATRWRSSSTTGPSEAASPRRSWPSPRTAPGACCVRAPSTATPSRPSARPGLTAAAGTLTHAQGTTNGASMTSTSGRQLADAPIASVDPELWAAMVGRTRPPDLEDRAHRQRELRLSRGARGQRLAGSPTSTRRASPAGATTAAASTSTWSSGWPRTAPWRSSGRRVRQRAAALRRAGQHRRLPRRARPRRHDPGHEPRPRRPPHPRPPHQLQRPLLRRPRLRRLARPTDASTTTRWSARRARSGPS